MHTFLIQRKSCSRGSAGLGFPHHYPGAPRAPEPFSAARRLGPALHYPSRLHSPAQGFREHLQARPLHAPPGPAQTPWLLTGCEAVKGVDMRCCSDSAQVLGEHCTPGHGTGSPAIVLLRGAGDLSRSRAGGTPDLPRGRRVSFCRLPPPPEARGLHPCSQAGRMPCFPQNC